MHVADWLDLRQYRLAALVLISFVFLQSLSYFDYVNINPTWHGRISNGLVLLLMLLCLISRSPRRMPAQYWFLGLLAVPMLSFLPCWLENGQSPVVSLRAYMNVGLALVYFLLHKSAIREQDLVNVLTAFAVVRTLIVIIQQFTYPDYAFTSRPGGLDALGDYQDIEIRSGLYRFAIEDTFLSMFLVFYYFWKLTCRFNPYDLFFFLFGLVGVYLDQTRQLMLSTILALALVMLFSRRIRRNWKIVLIVLVILGGIVAFFADRLFGELLMMTQGDLSNGQYIRTYAYTTYLLEFWGGPLSVIFGNGPIGGVSAYGEEIQYMYENLRLFHSDVGIVGAANLYGIVTVLFYFAFLVFFVFRNWKKLRIHLKMYFLAQIINLPMICIFTQNVNCMVFLAFMLFLCDRDIKRYDKLVQNKQSADADT